MKSTFDKFIIGFLIFLGFAAVFIVCYGIDKISQENRECKTMVENKPVEHFYVVEDKENNKPTWGWGYNETYKLVVSDIQTREIVTKRVGKYTYETTSIGDTITFFE